MPCLFPLQQNDHLQYCILCWWCCVTNCASRNQASCRHFKNCMYLGGNHCIHWLYMYIHENAFPVHYVQCLQSWFQHKSWEPNSWLVHIFFHDNVCTECTLSFTLHSFSGICRSIMQQHKSHSHLLYQQPWAWTIFIVSIAKSTHHTGLYLLIVTGALACLYVSFLLCHWRTRVLSTLC